MKDEQGGRMDRTVSQTINKALDGGASRSKKELEGDTGRGYRHHTTQAIRAL